MQRHLLTVNERLPRYVRMSLAGVFSHGTKLSEDQLMEALACHMAPETARVVRTGISSKLATTWMPFTTSYRSTLLVVLQNNTYGTSMGAVRRDLVGNQQGTGGSSEIARIRTSTERGRQSRGLEE